MALLGDAKLFFCLAFVACCCLEGELTDKVTGNAVSSLIT